MEITRRKQETKDKFIEAARKLVSLRGKENISMNDIAVASGLSRRTLYTYFSNRDEVYTAILENELNHLLHRLQTVMDKNLPPDKKLELYIFTRFEAIKEAVTHSASLKDDFERNIYEVEQARKLIDIKEIRMIKSILTDGINKQIFNLESPQWAAAIILYALKGVEAPYLNNNIGNHIKTNSAQIMDRILHGLTLQKK